MSKSNSISLDFPFSVVGVDLPARTVMDMKGETVEDFFRELSSQFGSKMRRYFFDEKGTWNSVLNILVNETSILYLNREKTVLKSGDVVTVLFPYSGG
ncbi:MAG: MoaD/ThiS family protein [Theionarchaea archaeon]|nr:MoaD/ThiS family protein [Theionarchaea archaeon]MBU7000498.1 MoaD/ThiS family protein [Theionarchaea archaeon]MBU7021541.1 MoaD/ThiS family protein [Theionarchaea archaeon]MBU7034072.1 MoaD/ThiS family protein [Theionarchaea archaeon]MBU7041444.1 MoaD/ThiS family protein [Theionarchaea archaeon]